MKTPWNWSKLALVFLLVYFSQVYPYVHFHHSHDDAGFPIEISMHLIDVEADACTDHHEDGHHHHTIDQGTDWYAVRVGARYTVLTIDLSYTSVGVSSVPNNEPEWPTREYTDVSLPDSVPLDSFFCRGPPTQA